MPKQTVRVVARITARPDSIEPLKAILLGLIGPTRAENGCISYQLLQNNADPTEFTFVEEWASDTAIHAHFTTPHLRDALAKGTKLFGKDPDIRKYSAIG